MAVRPLVQAAGDPGKEEGNLAYRYPLLLAAAMTLGGMGMADIPADSPLRQAPRLVAAAGELPQAELLATPAVRVLLGYTRRLLKLPDGHTFGVFSFSSSAPANWLFLVDSRDLSVKRYSIPQNDIGSHGGALGADGNIYTMPYGNGRVYEFTVSTGMFDTVTTELPAKEYTWEAFGAANGRIYFGTYPHAYLGEYDPATKQCALWRQVAPNTTYVTQFSEDADGLIHFRAWGPDTVWMSFDPETGELRQTEMPPAAPSAATALPPPPLPAGETGYFGRFGAGGRQFAVSQPSARLWEMAEDGLQLRGDPELSGEPYWWLAATDSEILGISYFGGLFRYDLKTGEYQRSQLDNLAPGGNGVMLVEAVTPQYVIGANYSQQNLWRVDVDTGEVVQSPTVIAKVTGEPMCAVGHGGKGYVGIYVSSVLSVYDPTQPFAYGANPRELADLGIPYKQTRPRAAVTDGDLVYISSDSDYGYLGGALAVIEPETEKVDVYHQVVPDQNLPTLAYDPANRLLWGGTDRWGQMRSCPPTQESSLIYAFDPGRREVVATQVLWPGSDVTGVLGVSPQGILIATSGTEIALVDTATREVLYQGASPVGVPSRVLWGEDGRGYCLADGTLYRWDLAANALTAVAETPGCTYLTQPRPGLWVVGSSTSVYRIRLEP